MKKLLILAGVIALTTTTQVFAQEDKAPQGPCPCPRKEAPRPEFGCPDKAPKPHFDMKKFEDTIKLTDAQKAKAKQFRDKEERAIAPIREQMKIKHQEMEAIFNEKLTLKERQDKLAPIQRDMDTLKGQMHKIHEQGKKDFESILTSKQLKKLDKLKANAKKEFKKAHKADKRDMHKRPPMPPRPECPFGPEGLEGPAPQGPAPAPQPQPVPTK